MTRLVVTLANIKSRASASIFSRMASSKGGKADALHNRFRITQKIEQRKEHHNQFKKKEYDISEYRSELGCQISAEPAGA